MWRSFMAACRLLFSGVDAQLQRDAGMPLGYYEILVRLSETPGHALRMSQLAEATAASKSRASHAVARLEERGWVRRMDCPTDRRGQVAELTALLNRQRLAGYASYVLSPRYLSVDLQVTVLAEPDQFRGNVEAAVLARLRPGQPPGGLVGFFDHSQWRFGMPLQWSMLAAAVQAVPGVAGVLSIDYRLRGVQAGFTAMPDTVTVAPDQILRADDDPSRPEAGSVTVIAEGGK